MYSAHVQGVDMKLPNFLVCGTMKGGTTSLYYYLKAHPEIYLPPTQEVHFFDLHFHKGIEFYKKHFSRAKEKHKAIGEVTPAYMYLDEIPERIHETLPDTKLIFLLRNPVTRAYSHYWHALTRWGVEYLPFEKAIEVEPERISRGRRHKIYYSYLDRGKYALQLKRFRKYFDREQMLILTTEEFKSNPKKDLESIFEFLEVEKKRYEFNVISKRHNIGYSPKNLQLHMALNRILGSKTTGKSWILGGIYRKWLSISHQNKLLRKLFFNEGYPQLNETTKRKLANYFSSNNQELEKFLKKKIQQWELT